MLHNSQNTAKKEIKTVLPEQNINPTQVNPIYEQDPNSNSEI